MFLYIALNIHRKIYLSWLGNNMFTEMIVDRISEEQRQNKRISTAIDVWWYQTDLPQKKRTFVHLEDFQRYEGSDMGFQIASAKRAGGRVECRSFSAERTRIGLRIEFE